MAYIEPNIHYFLDTSWHETDLTMALKNKNDKANIAKHSKQENKEEGMNWLISGGQM